MKLTPLVWKNLRHNPVRTALTISGVAVAAFVLSLFLSMQSTMAGVVSKAAENNNLVVLQGNAWCSTESRIPESYAQAILNLPEVKEAMPVYVSTTSC